MEENPLAMFRYGLKSPITRVNMKENRSSFFDFVNLEDNSLETRTNLFYTKSKENIKWTETALMNYMIHQRERVENNEISANTLSNYYKPIRAFCEMNDLELNWKNLSSKTN